MPDLSWRYGLHLEHIYGTGPGRPGLTVWELARYVDHLQQIEQAAAPAGEGGS